MMSQAGSVLGWLFGGAQRLFRQVAVASHESARVRDRRAAARALAADYEALGWEVTGD